VSDNKSTQARPGFLTSIREAFFRGVAAASPLWAAAALGATSPAPGPAESVPQITVIAPRPPKPQEIAGDNVATFILKHGQPSRRIGQLGRWVQPVCALTQGLAPSFNDFISARIQAISAAVHAPQTTSQRCETNAMIVFTAEPQKFLDDVAKRRPNWLGFHFEAEVPKLQTMTQPIQAWYSTATHNRSLELNFQKPFAGAQPDIALDNPSATPGAALGSRINTGMESFIVFTLVVIDTKAIINHPVGSIADYIAMMVLAQTQITQDCGALPSILDLMNPQCRETASDSITAGDVAYLKALYSVDLAHDVGMQRSSIEDLMMRSFKNQK
jgi:hypothetical protein